MPASTLLNTYGRQQLAFEHGEGCWLYDTDGNKYFDAISGIAVCGLGHCHPAVTAAIREQAGRLVHCSNLFSIPQQNKLAEALIAASGMERAFFCNSGAEANEAAIKLARKHGHTQNIDTPTIIVMNGAFHGRTMATLTATGNRKVQAGFEPLLKGFVRAELNQIDAIENIARQNPNIVAVLLEPVQGEGGIQIAESGYLQKLEAICRQHDWLLMLDEVQTGNGRCGSYFAFQQHNISPDVVTTAKGLGNGFPIGACLTRGRANDVFVPGSHGSTYGGNPLACAAALAVVETITEQNLAQRAKELGDTIVGLLKENLEGADYIKDIRGQGLMIGIEMQEPCPEIVPLARSKGLLVNLTAERVIRLLPVLTMTDEEAVFLAETLVTIIKTYAGDDRQKPR